MYLFDALREKKTAVRRGEARSRCGVVWWCHRVELAFGRGLILDASRCVDLLRASTAAVRSYVGRSERDGRMGVWMNGERWGGMEDVDDMVLVVQRFCCLGDDD